MPRLIVTQQARFGISRCRRFLAKIDLDAAKRATVVIARQINVLATLPEIGRPYVQDQSLRELIIEFGRSGYIALYRYDRVEDTIYVLAFRHQNEAGY